MEEIPSLRTRKLAAAFFVVAGLVGGLALAEVMDRAQQQRRPGVLNLEHKSVDPSAPFVR